MTCVTLWIWSPEGTCASYTNSSLFIFSSADWKLYFKVKGLKMVFSKQNQTVAFGGQLSAHVPVLGRTYDNIKYLNYLNNSLYCFWKVGKVSHIFTTKWLLYFIFQNKSFTCEIMEYHIALKKSCVLYQICLQPLSLCEQQTLLWPVGFWWCVRDEISSNTIRAALAYDISLGIFQSVSVWSFRCLVVYSGFFLNRMGEFSTLNRRWRKNFLYQTFCLLHWNR